MKQFGRAADFRYERSGQSRLDPIIDDTESRQRSTQYKDGLLSDRSRVETFLHVINKGNLTEGDEIELREGMKGGTYKSWSMDIPTNILTHYRSLFGALVVDPSIASPSICMELASAVAPRVGAVPAPTVESGRFRMGYRVAKVPVSSLFEWHLVLLLGNFLDDLCQCGLPSCGRFFLVQPTLRGRPRRDYCTDKHRKEFSKQDGVMRTNASRAGVTTEVWREIKSKHPGMTPANWKANKGRKSR